MSTIKRVNVAKRLSDMAVFNNVAYLAGQVADDVSQDVTGQTAQVLRNIERLELDYLVAIGGDDTLSYAAHLDKQGVKVTVQRESAPDADVGGVILSRAADHDIDLIVMGVYGHSRVREWAMGGASRSMLGAMTVPVLMSH